MILDAVEARMLGSLIEKEMTTPEYYPLTIKALQAACNQLTNREPVSHYQEEEIEMTLRALEQKGLVGFSRQSGGRTLRWLHRCGAALRIDEQQQAIIALLLLRGPQTAGELKGRLDRYRAFPRFEEVDDVLSGLIHRDEPLVERREREPGQKEPRYATLLLAAAGQTRPTAATPVGDVWEEIALLHRRIDRVMEALGFPTDDGRTGPE